jgi:hypothetical protein
MNINEILKQHSLWLADNSQGKRAVLHGANLYGANLSGANLSRANLSGADLLRADLRRADLLRADLSGADLSNANLSNADLSGANLYGANLFRADLSGADLSGANLSGAVLHRANLCNVTIAKDFISDGGYHHIHNVGSENGILELYSCGDKGWYIKRGCFEGSLDEFIAKVIKTHGDNEHAQQYLDLVGVLCKGNK